MPFTVIMLMAAAFLMGAGMRDIIDIVRASCEGVEEAGRED